MVSCTLALEVNISTAQLSHFHPTNLTIRFNGVKGLFLVYVGSIYVNRFAQIEEFDFDPLTFQY